MPEASSETIRISAIIPTLNEARDIARTIGAIRASPRVTEVIVVDGGSDDATVACATGAGARVIHAPRGRGRQMHAGALAASGDTLWFVHADTVVPAGAGEAIQTALADPDVVGGTFSLRFGGDTRAARFMSWFYRWIALLGLRYGDAAYFVRRSAYDRAGGFRDLALFEDLDLKRRLSKCGRFPRIEPVVVTSSRRFEVDGFPRVFAMWVAFQLLYWFGVPPKPLARWYRHVRAG